MDDQQGFIYFSLYIIKEPLPQRICSFSGFDQLLGLLFGLAFLLSRLVFAGLSRQFVSLAPHSICQQVDHSLYRILCQLVCHRLGHILSLVASRNSSLGFRLFSASQPLFFDYLTPIFSALCPRQPVQPLARLEVLLEQVAPRVQARQVVFFFFLRLPWPWRLCPGLGFARGLHQDLVTLKLSTKISCLIIMGISSHDLSRYKILSHNYTFHLKLTPQFSLKPLTIPLNTLSHPLPPFILSLHKITVNTPHEIVIINYFQGSFEMKRRTKAILIFTAVFWGLVTMGLFLFGYSFTKIYVGQVALQQSIWSKTIQRTLTPGVYHRGLKSRSITFPSTIQYIIYSNTSANGPLTLISKDMQQFTMDYTLAYRIVNFNSSLQDAYTKYQDTFVSRMRAEVNNIIMSTMSAIQAKSVWGSAVQDIIKEAIYNRFKVDANSLNSPNNLEYGTEIHGFWMSNFLFTSLEGYFQNAYLNSQSSSLAYKNSILSLNNINIQKSSLEALITATIRNQNATNSNNYIAGYESNSNLPTKKREFANYINDIAGLSGNNDSFLAYRNFTQFVFT